MWLARHAKKILFMTAKITTPKEKRAEISKEKAFGILKGYATGIFRAFDMALDKFNTEIQQTSFAGRDMLEAPLLNAKLKDAFAEAFPDKWLKARYRRFILRFDGVQIIIKKLSKHNKPSYVPTILSEKILSQIQADLFDGDEAAMAEPILIFGYTRNNLGQYVDPRIIYYNGGARWIISTEDFMLRAVSTNGNTERIVVRTKRRATKKEA